MYALVDLLLVLHPRSLCLHVQTASMVHNWAWFGQNVGVVNFFSHAIMSMASSTFINIIFLHL